MIEIWGAVLVIAVLAGALWWRERHKTSGGDEPVRTLEGLDTLAAWQPQATRVLSTPERLAYGVLVRALPDYIVFAQIPLARFIRVPTRHSYAEWLQRVGSLCPDLLICDSSSQVVCAVDVRPPPQQINERAKKRHERVRRVLKAADIPLHVWTEGALPTPEAAREMLFPKPPAEVAGSTLPPPQATPATKAVPVPKLAVPETFEVEPDEIIEMREPPPSTWFDNFQTGPAPLAPLAPKAPAAAPEGSPKPPPAARKGP